MLENQNQNQKNMNKNFKKLLKKLASNSSQVVPKNTNKYRRVKNNNYLKSKIIGVYDK